MRQRLALVPVDRGSHLEHLAAARRAQRGARGGERGLDGGGDVVPPLGVDIAVVNLRFVFF